MKDKITTLLKIKKLATDIDHDVAFGGKSKGNQHLRRVVRIAKFMGKKQGADDFIVTASAYLHDTALPSGNDYDYIKNKEIIEKLLTPFNLTKEEVTQISEAVSAHEGTSRPKSLEAKIVHDADVLEKTGILGVIRHTWKLTNFGQLDPANITTKDVDKILQHLTWRQKRLQTDMAKKIAKYLTTPISLSRAKMIISLSSRLADRGVVTEKIALKVSRHLGRRQAEKLKEQLNLGYLKRFK